MSRRRKPGFGPVDSRIERREAYKVRGMPWVKRPSED
jgi:hypothetical protein